MNRFSIFTLAALTMASSVAQAASLLATGGVYGGNTQRFAYCYIFNGSEGDITFGPRNIFNQDGSTVSSINKGHCGWNNLPLSPNRTCLIAANIGPSSTYACKIWIYQPKAAIRGTFDLRDANNNVLISSPLR